MFILSTHILSVFKYGSCSKDHAVGDLLIVAKLEFI